MAEAKKPTTLSELVDIAAGGPTASMNFNNDDPGVKDKINVDEPEGTEFTKGNAFIPLT